jgi:hypothetical protein
LDGTLPVIRDELLFDWTRSPPENLLRRQTVFRQCAPADIAKNCWTLLKPAIKEISDTFGIKRPDVEREMPLEAEYISSNRFELLCLNHFYRSPCLLGICEDKYVVAATKISNVRLPFEPYRHFMALQALKFIQSRKYKARYRHFTAAFNTGYAFKTERQKLQCCVKYGLDFGVHGKCYMWAVLCVEELFLPVPARLLLPASLIGLEQQIDRLNLSCQQFVHNLDTQWLKKTGMESTYKLIKELTAGTQVPYCVIETLRTDWHLSKCLTYLDVLRAIMRAFYLKTDDIIPSLIPLAKKFLN